MFHLLISFWNTLEFSLSKFMWIVNRSFLITLKSWSLSIMIHFQSEYSWISNTLFDDNDIISQFKSSHPKIPKFLRIIKQIVHLWRTIYKGINSHWMYQSSGQSASCAKKGKIRNRVRIKTKSLLEMFFKVLLRVMRKFLFWVVTLRLNTKLTICSVISSLWYMGVWRSWAEFPDGVKSIAGFFFSSICLHILFWEILWKISKKSWQPAFSSHRKFHYWNTLSWYQIRTQTQSIFLVFSTQENMPNCF